MRFILSRCRWASWLLVYALLLPPPSLAQSKSDEKEAKELQQTIPENEDDFQRREEARRLFFKDKSEKGFDLFTNIQEEFEEAIKLRDNLRKKIDEKNYDPRDLSLKWYSSYTTDYADWFVKDAHWIPGGAALLLSLSATLLYLIAERAAVRRLRRIFIGGSSAKQQTKVDAEWQNTLRQADPMFAEFEGYLEQLFKILTAPVTVRSLSEAQRNRMLEMVASIPNEAERAAWLEGLKKAFADNPLSEGPEMPPTYLADPGPRASFKELLDKVGEYTKNVNNKIKALIKADGKKRPLIGEIPQNQLVDSRERLGEGTATLGELLQGERLVEETLLLRRTKSILDFLENFNREYTFGAWELADLQPQLEGIRQTVESVFRSALEQKRAKWMTPEERTAAQILVDEISDTLLKERLQAVLDQAFVETAPNLKYLLEHPRHAKGLTSGERQAYKEAAKNLPDLEFKVNDGEMAVTLGKDKVLERLDKIFEEHPLQRPPNLALAIDNLKRQGNRIFREINKILDGLKSKLTVKALWLKRIKAVEDMHMNFPEIQESLALASEADAIGIAGAVASEVRYARGEYSVQKEVPIPGGKAKYTYKDPKYTDSRLLLRAKARWGWRAAGRMYRGMSLFIPVVGFLAMAGLMMRQTRLLAATSKTEELASDWNSTSKAYETFVKEPSYQREFYSRLLTTVEIAWERLLANPETNEAFRALKSPFDKEEQDPDDVRWLEAVAKECGFALAFQINSKSITHERLYGSLFQTILLRHPETKNLAAKLTPQRAQKMDWRGDFYFEESETAYRKRLGELNEGFKRQENEPIEVYEERVKKLYDEYPLKKLIRDFGYDASHVDGPNGGILWKNRKKFVEAKN